MVCVWRENSGRISTLQIMLKEKSCGGEMESRGVKRDFSFSCQVLILQEYNHVLLR